MTEEKRENQAINDNDETNKRPAPKEKLGSIMDAASALTSLGDEDSEGSRPSSPKAAEEEEAKVAEEDDQETKATKESPKRYLPEHKKPDAAPTFPEKMMSLMQYAEKQEKEGFCIAWCEDGKSFVISNPDEFTRQVVPKFFKATKFSSFTRKLYRWGFRQINRGIGPDDPIIFGSEFFQRDNPELIAKMRSVTAAGTRKHEQHRMAMLGASAGKRAFDDRFDEDSHKRMFFDQMYHQQKHLNMMQQNPSFYGGMNPNGSMPLSNALRPNLMPSGGSGPSMGHMGNPNMMNHPPNNNMMMNVPNVPNVPVNQYMHPNPMQNSQYPSGPQYPNAQSTAEIVNAAINALRHAS